MIINTNEDPRLGNDLDVLGEVILPITIGKAQISHDFIVVSGLIAKFVLGVDFLSRHDVCLDFKNKLLFSSSIGQIPTYHNTITNTTIVHGIELENNEAEECYLPNFHNFQNTLVFWKSLYWNSKIDFQLFLDMQKFRVTELMFGIINQFGYHQGGCQLIFRRKLINS